MAGPLPIAVTVSAAQQAVLERLLRQHSCPQVLALRIRIVLGAAQGLGNEPLARHLACSPTSVRKWRGRWGEGAALLAASEAEDATLVSAITTILADAPRPGTPDTFTAEQIVAIVNLACLSPRAYGRPIDAWTPRELADEAVRQGVVTRISPTTVGRFLGRDRSSTTSEPLLAQRQNQDR